MKFKKGLKYFATPAKIFMTVLILLIALLILQFFIIEIMREFARTIYTPLAAAEVELAPEEKRIKRIKNSTKEFLSDGTIYLVQREQQYISDRYVEFEWIYDANGNLLWKGPRDERPYKFLSWCESLPRRGFTPRQLRRMQMITPGFSRNIEILARSGEKTSRIWRYKPGSDIFIGYYLKVGLIGYAGATGFTDSKSKAEPFGKFRCFNAWCPEDSTSTMLLWQTQRRIYQIDFDKQNVELLFESDFSDITSVVQNAWIVPVPGTKEYFEHQKYRPLLHCKTKDGKDHLIMRNPKQNLTISIPEDWENLINNQFQFTATKQGVYLLRHWTEFRKPPDYLQDRQLYDQWWRDYERKRKNSWVGLYKIDNQSNFELVNRYGYDWTLPSIGGTLVSTEDNRPAVQCCVAQFSPPFYDLTVHLLGRKFWSWAHDHQYGDDIRREVAQVIEAIRPHDNVINWVLSLLMMAFTFLHGWPRRTSWVKVIFWLVFVGIFNLAGLLTYLALNHTTVIKCPACGKSRGLIQVNCVRCQAELPAPEQGKFDLIFNN